VGFCWWWMGLCMGRRGGGRGGWLILALDGCDISIDIGISSNTNNKTSAATTTTIDVAAVHARLAKSLSKSQAILSQLQVSQPFNPSASLSKCHTQITHCHQISRVTWNSLESHMSRRATHATRHASHAIPSSLNSAAILHEMRLFLLFSRCRVSCNVRRVMYV